MKIYRIASNFRTNVDSRYPKSTGNVCGLNVLDNVPNTSSISSSFAKYYTLEGIRVLPMNDFSITGKSYSVGDNNRIKELEDKIKQSKTISPLIVAVDPDGPYILEGVHRIDALYNIGCTHFPALVVVDMDLASELEQEEVDKLWNRWEANENL